MPRFSDASSKKLATCHEDLQKIFNFVVMNYDCTVIDGHRDHDMQEKYFNEGKTKLHYPFSKHNISPSMAVDVVPYPINWNDLRGMAHFAGFVKGVAACFLANGYIINDIRWGGDWNKDNNLENEKFLDYPHFELYDY